LKLPRWSCAYGTIDGDWRMILHQGSKQSTTVKDESHGKFAWTTNLRSLWAAVATTAVTASKIKRGEVQAARDNGVGFQA
jgi:hypothetical protein